MLLSEHFLFYRSTDGIFSAAITQLMILFRGCAFLWVHPKHRDGLQPLVTSHNYLLDFKEQFFFQVSTIAGTSSYLQR